MCKTQGFLRMISRTCAFHAHDLPGNPTRHSGLVTDLAFSTTKRHTLGLLPLSPRNLWSETPFGAPVPAFPSRARNSDGPGDGRFGMIRAFLLLFWISFAPSLRADDFNRPDVAYTHTASSLGWYWQASGAGTWSLTDHEILVNNANPSVQEPEQTLYHTRVSLQSGDWSASVDVRGETTSRRAGLVFMVSGGGTSHYQIRLLFGTRQVQVLQRGSAGDQTIYTSDTSSSEIFATSKYYTISAGSTAPTQFNWTVKNPAGTVVASGSFTDASYPSGYAGIIKSVGDGNSDICHFDNFYVREITVPPITQPHPRLLLNSADVVEIKNAINAQVEPRYSAWLDLKSRADAWSNDPVGAPYTGRDSSVFFDRSKVAGSQAAKMALAYLLKGNAAHAVRHR